MPKTNPLDKRISTNFTLREFACKCGCGLAEPKRELVQGLEDLRALLSNIIGRSVPITINSGHRCAAHNKKEGGKPESRHLTGQAADIRAKGFKPQEIYDVAKNMPVFKNGGIGLYKTFVHLDVDHSEGARRWIG